MVAVTFADRAPGAGGEMSDRRHRVVTGAGTGVRFGSRRRRWGPGSSRRSIAPSSPGVRSTVATGVLPHER